MIRKEQEIVRYVKENQVTIVNSYGCGNMPIYLAQASYKVIVGTSVDGIVEKYKRNIKKDTSLKVRYDKDDLHFLEYQIGYLVYGSHLISEILKHQYDKHTVLMISDSSNYINADLVIALIHQLITNGGASLRVVIINKIMKYNDKLSTLFEQAPIVDFSQNFHVTYKLHHTNELKDLVLFYTEHSIHRNILVILPHQIDIKKLKEELESYFLQKKDPLIISLDRDFNCNMLKSFQKKIILATDHAHSILFKSNINVVIDAGLETKWKFINEIPVLTCRNVSKAIIQERMALASHFSPGLYCLCSDFDYSKFSRKEVDTIFDEYLSKMILSLINFDIDIDSLKLLYSKSFHIINGFLKSLRLIGAIDEEGKITSIGKEILSIPLKDVRFSRILIEAKKYHLEFDILLCYVLKDYWINHLTIENVGSDLLAHLYFIKSLYFNKNTIQLDSETYIKYENLKAVLDPLLSELNIQPSKYSNTDILKKCIACGFPDCLFVLTDENVYTNLLTGKYSFIPSKFIKEPGVFVLNLFSFINRSYFYSRILNRRALFYTTLSYRSDEVMECFSKELKITYFTNGSDIFERYTYRGLSIYTRSIGKIEDLKQSCPEDFREERSENRIVLYFRNVEIDSRPYISFT